MATLTQVPAPPLEAAPTVSPSEISTEVSAKPRRRTFSAEYKRRILEETDACALGEIGALLRREGLYSSHLVEWRRARKRGDLAALMSRRRGPKAQPPDAKDKRIAELERALRREKARADRAEAIVEVQKKVSQLLGIPLPNTDDDSEGR
jgi:transposase